MYNFPPHDDAAFIAALRKAIEPHELFIPFAMTQAEMSRRTPAFRPSLRALSHSRRAYTDGRFQSKKSLSVYLSLNSSLASLCSATAYQSRSNQASVRRDISACVIANGMNRSCGSIALRRAEIKAASS